MAFIEAGKAGVNATPLYPDNAFPANIYNGSVYEAKDNGYAISDYTDITPTVNGTPFSSGFIRTSSSGYAYSSRPTPTETVLWTNPSPTADFTAQTVNLTKNGVAETILNYDYIKVMYKYNKSDLDTTAVSAMMSVEDFVYCETKNVVKQKFLIGAHTSSYNNVRDIAFDTNTSIYIGGTARAGQSGTNNANVTPLQIIGITGTL